MWTNCPPYLLRDELECLMPRVLVIFGSKPHAALRTLYPGLVERMVGELWRGRLEIAGQPVAVIKVGHPRNAKAWGDGQADLPTSLEADPI